MVFIFCYLGLSVGYFIGWIYWIGLIFVCMVELMVMVMYVKFWLLNVFVWLIEISFLLILVGVNLMVVWLFGEVEFWFVMIKIVVIIVLIIIGIFMMVGYYLILLG